MPFFSLVPTALSSALIFAQAATAAAPGANGQPQPSPLLNIAPFFFMAVIFYFVLIRPQQKRAKEQSALLSAIRSGDEVVVNGLHGFVTNPRDAESKTVLVKFGENTKIEVDKSAITTVLKPGASKEAAVAKS